MNEFDPLFSVSGLSLDRLRTFLRVAEADPRAIQALIRHRDLRLTAQRYTDTAGLALTDAVAKPPGFDLTDNECTQIGAQISVPEGHFVSQADAANGKIVPFELFENEGIKRSLTRRVAGGRMVRAAGFEPATPSV